MVWWYVLPPSKIHGVYVLTMFSYRKQMNQRKSPLDFLDIKLEGTLEISPLKQL
jgi:hypothetical protein